MAKRLKDEPRTVIGANAISERLHQDAVRCARTRKFNKGQDTKRTRALLDLTKQIAADLIESRLGAPATPRAAS